MFFVGAFKFHTPISCNFYRICFFHKRIEHVALPVHYRWNMNAETDTSTEHMVTMKIVEWVNKQRILRGGLIMPFTNRQLVLSIQNGIAYLS